MSDARKPWVTFEVRPVEDRNRSLLEGQYVTKDVDYIIIVPHGSEGKLQIERPYADWLKDVKPHTQDLRAVGAASDTPVMGSARFPSEWVRTIEEGYKAWKEDREMPVEGTPLANWPVIAPSQRNTCLALHIRTVEELAGADDEAVGRLGMGGVSLRQRAQDWMKMNGSESAKVTAEMETLRSTNASLQARLAKLESLLAVPAAPAKQEE